ncbi:MAG TPA: hypothetical protein PK659_09170 [Methanothrix sp.]|nr:hypothetical protein [Methanothrix sp.]HOL44408.1 hypothetical protein [Methanothrix sp.]
MLRFTAYGLNPDSCEAMAQSNTGGMSYATPASTKQKAHPPFAATPDKMTAASSGMSKEFI